MFSFLLVGDPMFLTVIITLNLSKLSRIVMSTLSLTILIYIAEVNNSIDLVRGLVSIF